MLPFHRRHAAMSAAAALVYDQAGADVLIHGLADDFVLALEVVDAVLLVGEASAALAAHEGVLLPALVLEVAIQVVVPVVRPLQHQI